MAWLVDNAQTLYILIGMSRWAWALPGGCSGDASTLIGAAPRLACVALVWLLTHLIVTDRQQLDANIHAMADAVVTGKTESLVKLLAADFEFQGHKPPELAAAVVRVAKQYKVHDIYISNVDVEDMTATTAKVYFRATARARGDDRPYMVACRGMFVKEGREWKLKQARFFNPVVNEEIHLPLP